MDRQHNSIPSCGPALSDLLRAYAEKYETPEFICGDPSWFMHQVEGPANQETTAFVASCLSYGSRSQFMPKIQWLLDCARGDMYEWVRKGQFEDSVRNDCNSCFYRLYTVRQMNLFLRRLQQMLLEYATLGNYVRSHASNGLSAVQAVCKWFASDDSGHIVPKDAQSACKRICMFLRWMVRGGSPVDLGLWEPFIDRRTLIMPLDTHVVGQACRLGLISSKSTSMAVARRLTQTMAQVFPDDPLKGDFALFGYGVNS